MYARIISSNVPVEVKEYGTNQLIQLSNLPLKDFELVIEDEQPTFDAETQYLAYDYRIIDNRVHKVYRVEAKPEETEENI